MTRKAEGVRPVEHNEGGRPDRTAPIRAVARPRSVVSGKARPGCDVMARIVGAVQPGARGREDRRFRAEVVDSRDEEAGRLRIRFKLKKNA